MPDPQIRGYLDLSERRARLRLSGADRQRYLNGQITNNVAKATREQTIHACVCDHKGKLQAEVFVTESEGTENGKEGNVGAGAFWIDGPAELREELLARLDRYIIADDAELTDVTDEFSLIHVVTGDELPRSSLPSNTSVRRSNRLGMEGYDLWLPRGKAPELPAWLEGFGLKPLSEADCARLRIIHGMGAWGTEIVPGILPQEALLDRDAIDFHKGCYIGQEVISRIRSVGRVNRQMRALVRVSDPARLTGRFREVLAAAGDEPAAGVAAGDLLFGFIPDSATSAEPGELTEAGKITSVAFHDAGGTEIALGLVKRNFDGPGTFLFAGPAQNRLSSVLEIRNTPLL